MVNEFQPIGRILVANRGEIAVRIIRACRAMGIESVIVASDADLDALPSLMADQVVPIGGTAPGESYLMMDKVIAAGVGTGCDAVHPGYGFLAENAGFARAVAAAGLRFLGPSPEVMEAMGLKTRARDRMAKANVPVVPGCMLGDDSDHWVKAGKEVGFPLLVKASAGGGGKGMRAVHQPTQLVAAIEAAQREASAAFGDATVYLERLLVQPRHVEVQILGDTHGNVVHLGERDCSVQRRHQKIIEESPAPRLSDELRQRICETARQAALAVGYVGAGTVEMLLDANGEFFFLEMNTRLQVEHPVSELVSGTDLVVAQIRVAQGESISDMGLDQIEARGHAIEARLYAEDPAHGFLPQAGDLLLFEVPVGPGVRVDSGVRSGDAVTLHYDPMIAKITAHGEDRDQARRRLVQALRETVVLGVQTNLAYLIDVLEHDAFADGLVHTGFVESHMTPWPAEGVNGDATIWLAAAAVGFMGSSTTVRSNAGDLRPTSLWESLGPHRMGGAAQ